MAGQPEILMGSPPTPAWVFNLEKLEAVETGGTSPGLIVNSPNTFTLRSTIKNEGALGSPLISPPGTTGQIAYFAELLTATTPTRVALPTKVFVMNALSVDVDSAAISTGAGATLTAGVWLITAFVSFPGTLFAATVAGFNQTLVEIL